MIVSMPTTEACSYMIIAGPSIREIHPTAQAGLYNLDIFKVTDFDSNDTSWDWVDNLGNIVLDVDNNVIVKDTELLPLDKNEPETTESDVVLSVTNIANNTMEWTISKIGGSFYSFNFTYTDYFPMHFTFYSSLLDRAYLVAGPGYSSFTASMVFDLGSQTLSNLTLDFDLSWVGLRQVYHDNLMIELNAGCCFCVNSYFIKFDSNSLQLIHEDNVFNTNYFDTESDLIISVDRFHNEGIFEVEEIQTDGLIVDTWEFSNDDLRNLIDQEIAFLDIQLFPVVLGILIFAVIIAPRRMNNWGTPSK